MTALRNQGENWSLLTERNAGTQLKEIVTMSALANAKFNGVNDTFNAYLGAAVNVVVFCGCDVGLVQKMLQNIADELPEMVAAARLNNTPPANTGGKPS